MTSFWVDEDFRRYLIAEPIGARDSESLSFTLVSSSLLGFPIGNLIKNDGFSLLRRDFQWNFTDLLVVLSDSTCFSR